MKREYKILSKNSFSFKEYRLIPIRKEDKYIIMKWRNDQIFHLRQKKPLTKNEQDQYFKSTIDPLFEQSEPNQILFSFLKNDRLIGYGGLVHLNWDKKEAEISFLIQTTLQNHYFEKLWGIFLNLIEKVAFDYLELNKIYTYSFDLRPKLYNVLKKHSYVLEELKKKAFIKDDNLVDILIHSKFRNNLTYRHAIMSDSKLIYDWANEIYTRKNSFNRDPIKWEAHQNWLKSKLESKNRSQIFIFSEKTPVGVLRLDKKRNGVNISFSVDKNHRGKGIGSRMIKQIITDFSELNFYAEVIGDNEYSHKIFLKNGFEIINIKNDKIFTYQKINK